MEKLHEKSTLSSQPSIHTVHTSAHSSRSSSRRASGTNARERPLTPPPPVSDAREPAAANDYVFTYPPTKKDLPPAYQLLLDHAEREENFYRLLNNLIAQEHCNHAQQAAGESDSGDRSRTCLNCQRLHEECTQFIGPLHNRLATTATAALATRGAVEQLSRLYSIWDQFLSVEKEWRKRKECLQYVNLLNEKIKHVRDDTNTSKLQHSDTELELDKSIELLNTILASGNSASTKRSSLKQQRERSKSVMIDETPSLNREADIKTSHTAPYLLRRQSTYSEGKSKVSKWTKVKAAFKWERAANMPDAKDPFTGIGLTPNNHEVARYLRVPPMQCGGSSADSILSSSSGHMLSEVGTPGTISSASSMDDIDSSGRNTMRRDSTKSDSRYTDDGESLSERRKPESVGDAAEALNLSRSNSAKSTFPVKSSSIKSVRKSKAVSDFEVLPEDVIADIKSTSTRKIKVPPSPLNLNLKQDLNDLGCFYSPLLPKSPRDGTQSLNRSSKKIGSPGNSSVPSSPSRHSDFFAEFESEDLSSGDFSEPSTPTLSRIDFLEKQNEINQGYQMLRAKLDMEFEAKRREWEKMNANPKTCRALALITPPKTEEHSPNLVFNANLSAKQLEENLTPDFKKKLRKWRVKKQISLSGPQSLQASPNKENIGETKPKIDWNLWKTGQLKLEGQGLSPLPDQKDLPEEFQKKLEQWNKIKRGGSVMGTNDSMKRNAKHVDTTKKSSDDDRIILEKEKRSEKHKPHEKDKLEKLAKLKAIVTDHPAKEIEVKTSAGVMKFEGISRKFTRKLYEWEKARGIGPESSTFALLHPGYCPIDVGRITKESQNAENSPTLSRSLSLDSIAPNVNTIPAISQQASSLSLNDVNELKELDGSMNSTDPLTNTEFKKYEEPEAVMVEVEDHIVETASPLVTSHTLVEQQTPIYKYEEMACNDYCNSRRIQSYESHTNLAPLLSALKRTDELFVQLKLSSPEIAENEHIRNCEAVLSFIRQIYPYYTENLMKPNVLNAILDVQSELGRISELNQKSPLDEACCQEMMEERDLEYSDELKGLYESLILLRQNIHGGVSRYPTDILPDINVTLEDDNESEMYAVYDSTSKDQLSTTLEAADELSACSQLDNDTETPSVAYRALGNGNGAATGAIGKKKLRLRKMGSRQNSKTESDSTSEDDAHSVLETPRRLKRKNFRLKQRSLDEEYSRRSEEPCASSRVHSANPLCENMFVLKVKPVYPIQQSKSNVKISTSLMDLPAPQEEVPKSSIDEHASLSPNANCIVKTKRKIFTTIPEPTAIGGIAVIEQEVENAAEGGRSIEPPKKDGKALDATQVTAGEHAATKQVSSQLKLLLKPKKSILRKSLSLYDIRELDSDSERRCHSAESIKEAKKKLVKGTRPPLASDSFNVINKSYSTLTREPTRTPTVLIEDPFGSQKRKEHLFKKHSDKSTLVPSIKTTCSAMVKKIETKIAKTHSGSSVDQGNFLSPDKMDNSLPRISRKLERKSLTPTIQLFNFNYPTPTNSEPTSPHLNEVEQPRTPLSERAIRLQKAKEDFLQGTMPRGKPTIKRRDEIVRNDTWEQYRRSDQSLSSVTTTGEDGNLLKSISADAFGADTPTQSDAGTDQDSSVYDSLPRSVSRSGKISSKLGFATLASKFRRGVKVKKNKEKEAAPQNSALSALCRNTLMADIIAVPRFLNAEGGAERTPSSESVRKSQSSPQAVSRVVALGREHEQLNKSQSEQYVKQLKESLV